MGSSDSLSEVPLIEKASTAATEQTAQPYGDKDEEVEKDYQQKNLKFWTIMVGMYLSLFLVGLDRTIVATAIPKITDEFNSIGDIGWYGSAYMLGAACFFPISGRIYQLYSTRWVFVGSLVIFETGSVICGAAPSSTVLIFGRAIAGMGSACVFIGGMMIMFPLVPLRKRAVFTSIFGLCFGTASIVGPILGGAFTDNVTWRWCFYINLPIGGSVILAVSILFDIPSPKREKVTIFARIKSLDPIGILFFVPSIACLVLALQWGGSTFSWSVPKSIGLLVAFAVLFVIFIGVEILMPETAMIPTRIVLNRSVAGSLTFMFLLSGALMSIIYYFTIWFQVVKGDSALHSGISTLPLLLSIIVLSVPVAVVTQKIGYYVPSMLLCPFLCATGAGLLSTLTPSSGHSKWIGYQVLFGFGLGSGFQTSNLVPQNVLSRQDVPSGAALMFFMQQIGGSVFLSVSQSVFSTKLIERLSKATNLDAEAIVNTGATDLRKIVPASQLDFVIEAYNYSLTRIFIISAALSSCMILSALAIEWKRMGGNSGPAGGAKNDTVDQGDNNNTA